MRCKYFGVIPLKKVAFYIASAVKNFFLFKTILVAQWFKINILSNMHIIFSRSYVKLNHDSQTKMSQQQIEGTLIEQICLR